MGFINSWSLKKSIVQLHCFSTTMRRKGMEMRVQHATMETIEKVDPSCHIELSTAWLQGVDAEQQAMSIEFASREADWHNTTTKQLLWKIDLHLLPWVVLMYLTNFLDRKYDHSIYMLGRIQH